jgi:hypothetical protein
MVRLRTRSTVAYRKASEKFMALLWKAMLSSGIEDYACRIMTGEKAMPYNKFETVWASRTLSTRYIITYRWVSARIYARSTILLRQPEVCRTFCFVRLITAMN